MSLYQKNLTNMWGRQHECPTQHKHYIIRIRGHGKRQGRYYGVSYIILRPPWTAHGHTYRIESLVVDNAMERGPLE